MDKTLEEKKRKLIGRLYDLSESQIDWLTRIVSKFSTQKDFKRFKSDLISDCVLDCFGNALLAHHSSSSEPFSKDKFEYAFEISLNSCGQTAKLAPKGNPGHDITINNKRFSLKTQADKSIKVDTIHISKFKELGKGKWENVKDLEGLRDQFFNHMKSYDRILTLRAITKPPKPWHYELVEIPKSLLEEAIDGDIEMANNSKQTPKPGYCRVYDRGEGKSRGKLKFELYFDAGTERKLQIKKLSKKYCIIHAHWEFVIT